MVYWLEISLTIKYHTGGVLMGHIVVEDISKSYKVAIRKEGLKASIKQFIKPEYKLIRALENINF
jgi:ABC-type uncharacterized transport system ATPase subunit